MALAAPPFFQKEIVDFLKTRIDVKDDSAVTVPGHVSGDWYNADLFSSKGWQLSVGRENLISAGIADLGGENKDYHSSFELNVWVHVKRQDAIDYVPEHLMSKILHQIDTILWQIEMSGSQDFVFDLTKWTPWDEPENNLLRSKAVLLVWYSKNRGSSTITP